MLARYIAFALAMLPSSALVSPSARRTEAPVPHQLTASQTAPLDTALQDEYHAEQVYQQVLADFGSLRPFANVVFAEQRHASYIVSLLKARGAVVPSSNWNADNVPRFQTVRAACAGAADAEVANIAMYDRLLAGDLPADVRQVFERNRWASAARHLPAFTRCR